MILRTDRPMALCQTLSPAPKKRERVGNARLQKSVVVTELYHDLGSLGVASISKIRLATPRLVNVNSRMRSIATMFVVSVLAVIV